MTIRIKPNDPKKAEKYFSDKMDFTTGPQELSHLIDEGGIVNIVDVRDEEDYEEGHIPGAKSLPQDKWSTFNGLIKDQANIIYCYSQNCHLAAMAAKKFAAQGFPVAELDGGFEDWKEHDLRIERASSRAQSDSTVRGQRSEASSAPLE